jgi:hypothetical protein
MKGEGLGCCGERHHKAKLTKQQVKNIRQWTRSLKDWARTLGVNKSTIVRARSGLSWKHIEQRKAP